MQTEEIECRFLEIDKEALVRRLVELGASDGGEKMIEEMIIYDSELKWKGGDRFIRLRKIGDDTKLTYKEFTSTIDGTKEIEFKVGDFKAAELFFEKIGFVPFRHQQKMRHTFKLNGVTFDIDTWPKVPTFVELEGSSEQALRDAASLIGYDWKDATFGNVGYMIQEKYHIPVTEMRWFTFDRFE